MAHYMQSMSSMNELILTPLSDTEIEAARRYLSRCPSTTQALRAIGAVLASDEFGDDTSAAIIALALPELADHELTLM